MDAPSVIAVIGARKGSKRLPRKNRLILGGKPLYRHTLDAAAEAGVFHKIILTSDDPFILENAANPNSVALIDERPVSVADDEASIYDVGIYLMEKYPKIFNNSDYICFLNPCYPLRTKLHIQEAMRILLRRKPVSLVSVAPYPYPVGLSLEVKGGRIYREWEGLARSAEHETKYYPAGGIVAIENQFFRGNKNAYSKNTLPYITEFPASVDIDTASDFNIARILIESMNSKGKRN